MIRFRTWQNLYAMISFILLNDTRHVNSSSLPNSPTPFSKPVVSNNVNTHHVNQVDDHDHIYENEHDVPAQRSLQQHQQQESFEERTAAWRQQQQERMAHQTPQQAASSTDDQGRLKLIATVSQGSISFFFFILMWRAVHHYEMADNDFEHVTRLLLVLPTAGLFLTNMLGCVAAFTPPKNTTTRKKRLKLILNVNKIMECVLFTYNMIRLTILPSNTVIREVYVGRIMTNFIFLLQCQLFTKVTWDGVKSSSVDVTTDSLLSSPPPPPVYDDYNYQEDDEQYNRNYNYNAYDSNAAEQQQ